MEGNLKEIVTFLEGNFAEKKEIGRKPYVPKVEALATSLSSVVCERSKGAKSKAKRSSLCMHELFETLSSFAEAFLKRKTGLVLHQRQRHNHGCF